MQPGNNSDISANATKLSDSNIAISDVDATMWSYIRKHYWWELVLLLVPVVTWELLLFVFIAPALLRGTSSSNSGRGFGELAFLPLSLFLAWFYRLKKKFENTFLSEFAQANGYQYDANGTVDETYGTIFRMAGRAQVSDVISGTYKGCSLRLFLHDLTVSSGRSSVTYRNTIIELDLNGRLPNLMLVSKRSLNSGLNLASNSGLKNKLSLEGDFDKNFTLYAVPGTEIEALEIFAPDIMALMEDESQGYDVEFVANRIYIYVNKYIGTNQALEHAFELARLLVDKVGPIAARLQGDSAIPLAPVNLKTHRQGWQMSRTAEIIYAGVVILFVAIAVILGIVASKQRPLVSAGTTVQSQNPAYQAAINQAIADEGRSNQASNFGPQIVTDGQQALAAAQTNLGRSGAEYWIGLGYFWQRLYDTALAHEQTALVYDPNNSDALAAAGDLLINTGQYQAAIALANRQLVVDPNDASAYRIMAFAHANLGLKAQALADMDKATTIDQMPAKQQYRTYDAQDRALIESPSSSKLLFDPS